MDNILNSENVLPRKIVIATDFSIASGLAIGWGITWAKNCGAQLYIVHVIEPAEYQGPPELRNIVRKEVREEAERQLECYVDRLRSIPHEFVCLEGEVGKSLSDFVKDKNVDMLITGSRGRRGVRRVMLGSTAETIFHEVKCPVMTVGIRFCQLHQTRGWHSIRCYFLPISLRIRWRLSSICCYSCECTHKAQLYLLHVASLDER